MATLEKIRNKSVLLFIIIIVALLAFILGDFLTSGRTYFGSGTTMVKAGKVKVDYTDYQNRMNQVAEQQRNNPRQADNDDLSQEVLHQLLLEKLLEKEYNDLGIKVTDTELTEALTGPVPHASAQQFIYQVSANLGLPDASGQTLYDAMMHPEKYQLPAELGEQLRQAWASLERQVEAQMLREKYDNLVNGLFTANELDAKSMFNDVANTRHVSFVSKPVNSVPDEEVNVTDDDLRAAWNERREYYRIQEPQHAVEYILVRIEPSQEDRLAGQQEVENAIAALQESEGTASVATNPRFVTSTNNAFKSEITDNRLKQFVDTAKVGDTRLLATMGNDFTIVKLLGVTNEIDSINFTMIGAAGDTPLDSVLNELKGGKKFSEVVDNENIIGNDSVWASLAGPGMPAKIKDALENNALGQYFLINDTLQGQPINTIYRINKRKNPVPYYEIATIEYTIDPSQETINRLSNDLNTYVATNSNAADFVANAADANYPVLPAVVSPSSTHIGNVPDSRPAVKWVTKAKKGQVMPVYQDSKQTYLLAVAVEDVYDGNYLPYDAVAVTPSGRTVAEEINAHALHNLKAAKLVADYAGKANDVAGYATLMDAEPSDANVIFTSRMIPGIGFNESAVQGAIFAAPVGELVGPVAGNNAVVVFVVDSEDSQSREFTFPEYAAQFNRSFNLGNARPRIGDSRLFQTLLGKQKIKNNSLNFIQGHGE